MSLRELDNLVRIGQLKAEPRNEREVKRMLEMARTRLADAQLDGVSREGRFASAYNAAHSAALAALRWHGYRSENRYTVFLCLAHTVGWPASRWRVLDAVAVAGGCGMNSVANGKILLKTPFKQVYVQSAAGDAGGAIGAAYSVWRFGGLVPGPHGMGTARTG